MSINFNSLPSDKPFSVPEPGTYYAVVESAEMKQGKDMSKPPYLNLKFKLKNIKGESVGSIYDIIAESEAPLVRYKLKRFILALGIPLEGEFELRDLAKLSPGKELILDTKIEKGQDGRQDRAVVDLFTNEIFYNMSEANEVFGEEASDVINASDAEDAAPKTATEIIDEF